MKHTIVNFSSVALSAVLCAALAVHSSAKPRKVARHIYLTSNDRFNIRVQMFPEQGAAFVLGAYYVFQSSKPGSAHWVDIMTYKQDDPDPIPCDRVRFVSDTVAYVFMPYRFAVTTTGGTTWHVWDITKDLPRWRDARAAIKDVNIGSNGIGTMKLDLFSDRKPELHTSDYGVHWRED